MDDSILQWVVGQTGAVGVAALSIWVMKVMNEQNVAQRKEDAQRELERHQEAIRREQANADSHREDKRTLLDIVRANTESNVRLVDAINRLDRHVSKEVRSGTS